MYDRVTIRASDRDASVGFYKSVLGAAGIALTQRGATFAEWDDFSIAQATRENPVTKHLHIGFGVASRDEVDEFWRAGTADGYESDGAPGLRTEYGGDYYGSFLLDPDGNSAEAVHHDDLRRGNVDHLWIGVADLAASTAFYRTIAQYVGLREGTASSRRQQFRGARGTFSLLADGRPPTANLHIAFPVPSHANVDGFHRAALASGYEDRGEPRDRSEYHTGYYGARVLDPDGTTVEAVHHGAQAATRSS